MVKAEDAVDSVHDPYIYVLPSSPQLSQAQLPICDSTSEPLVLVSGKPTILAEVFDLVDEQYSERKIILSSSAKCCDIWQAVWKISGDSVITGDNINNTINLSLRINGLVGNGIPLPNEEKLLSELGMDFENGNDVTISFDRIIEFGVSNGKQEFEKLLEVRILDVVDPSVVVVLPYLFLVSTTTTFAELQNCITNLYIKNPKTMMIHLRPKYLRTTDKKSPVCQKSTLEMSMSELGLNLDNEPIVFELHEVRLEKDPDGKIKKLERQDYQNENFSLNSFKQFCNIDIANSYGKFVAPKPKEPETRQDLVYVGLVNQAMTCYLNSLIQALYMTPEFRNALYNWEYIDRSEKDEAKSIPFQLQKLFLNLQTSTKNAVETTSLTTSFGWDSTEAWQQHDIQELCRVMFDALEQTFKNTEQADLINRLYEGKMIDYVRCLSCKTEKSREDTFLDIPLPVRPFGSNVAYNSIEEALRAFVQPETLDDVNQYHCETCNKKSDAHKGLKFSKFPYLLTLHLKRFDFDYNTFQRIKLNDKVSFPNILCLNSFIPDDTTENQKLPITEEDAGVGVKCDDSSTTDSGNLDEIATIENGVSSTEIVNNTEQDDDEGIDMSNGPSTSSTHSQENERTRLKGPYQYELFSIMIHSGSASGGHYYAYIKDFRTQEWLCFNDQNVTPITNEDIQKTFGGGPTRGYYSGAYSSSTNAYMLMYRQIDSERNCQPMEVENFPKHIRELLGRMKEHEERTKSQDSSRMTKIQVTVNIPNENTSKTKKIYCLDDKTLQDALEKAYEVLNLENIVDIEQCRLVSWDPHLDLIEQSYEGKEKFLVSDICPASEFTVTNEMLLEIRDKDEKFQVYSPGALPTTVFIIDVKNKDVIDGLINVRALKTQSVLQYKQDLAKICEKPADDLIIALVKFGSPPKIIDNNDGQLKNEGFTVSSKNKVFVTSRADIKELNYDSTELITLFTQLAEKVEEVIGLTFKLPDTSKEILEEMNIPTLEAKLKEKEAEEVKKAQLENEKKKQAEEESCKNGEKEKDGTKQGTKALAGESEEWTDQISNSEDSSLSDSDRTLVGNASEDDDSLELLRPPIDTEAYLCDQEGNCERDLNFFFKIMPRYDRNGEKYLKVLVDKHMKFESFKKQLEPFIGVPMECFKFSSPSMDNGEGECIRPTMKFIFYDDGQILDVKLIRMLGANEIKLKIYQMMDLERIANPNPFSFVTDMTVLIDSTIGELKQRIVDEFKSKGMPEVPITRLRLRAKKKKDDLETAGKVYFDNQKINSLEIPAAQAENAGQRRVYFNNQKINSLEIPATQAEIAVQILTDDETVVNDDQIVIMVRRYIGFSDPSPPFQEIILSKRSIVELRDKVAELSGIPVENLEFHKGKWPRQYSCGTMQKISNSQWTPITCELSSTSDSREFQTLWQTVLRDGDVFYYRDSTDKQTYEEADECVQTYENTNKNRSLRRNRTPAVSTYRRRERALKIYVDDK